mmetsp:Transcript_18127/g.24296  ORF Transcript_18127/g.24296 Transcript_18127/m.24296 type:complete len:80 (+) Transcript_18127:87-326(+)
MANTSAFSSGEAPAQDATGWPWSTRCRWLGTAQVKIQIAEPRSMNSIIWCSPVQGHGETAKAAVIVGAHLRQQEVGGSG